MKRPTEKTERMLRVMREYAELGNKKTAAQWAKQFNVSPGYPYQVDERMRRETRNGTAIESVGEGRYVAFHIRVSAYEMGRIRGAARAARMSAAKWARSRLIGGAA